MFGLFHGLLLLPVLLGLFGPGSHRAHFSTNRLSRRLELDDEFCDHAVHNALDIADHFNVDMYEHSAEVESIANNRISTSPMESPPVNENLQLFLNFRSSTNNIQTLDVTPSHINTNNRRIHNANGTFQESSI